MMSWKGWGDPDRAQALSPDMRRLVHDALGVRADGPGVPGLAELQLPGSQLSGQVADRLAAVVGASHVSTESEARIRHLRGKSTPDLLALRLGDLSDSPDAVVWPGSHGEILELLKLCTAERIAVVPFGGGTSVVGGLAPDRTGFRAVVALDLSRLNRLVELDEISRLVILEPGLRGPEAEARLAEHGYTLGHFPQSFEFASIGGFAAARSSGQASAGYGRFDERVVALTVATPTGTVALGQAPKTAAGPDLRQLFLGSEGTLGVITSLTVEIRPVPALRIYEGWRLPDFAAGSAVVRRLIQDGPVPTVLRLSDEVETALNLARPEAVGASGGSGCLLITGWEGPSNQVEETAQATRTVLRNAGAELVEGAGSDWAAGRFAAPYLRDALLDAGALVETLETAGFWSALPALYESVRQALVQTLGRAGTPPVVLCHISHVYRSGASLYFTVACAQTADPLEQWRLAKAAASRAILAAGGSITHHHGIGTEHRAWHHRQLGEQPVAVLRAVKRELDPAGILNPGILV
jgi:alkyldihydroxyacetonephosphate synthase